jgi:hypothetical protein
MDHVFVAEIWNDADYLGASWSVVGLVVNEAMKFAPG